MHNGVIGGFMNIRRALLAELSEPAFNAVQSFHSDSAVAFALFLHHLTDLNARLQPAQLLAALEVALLQCWLPEAVNLPGFICN